MKTIAPAKNKLSAKILFFIIFFVAVVHWGPSSDLYIYLKQIYLCLISVILIILAFAKIKEQKQILIGRFFPVFFACMIFSAVSFLWSVNKFFALKDFIVFYDIFIVYFASIILFNKDDIPDALRVIILFGVILGAYDVVVNFNGLFTKTRLEHLSSLGNPIYLGEYLAISLSICLGLLITNISKKDKLEYLVLFTFLFFCLFLTQTRNSMLALLLLVGFLMLKKIKDPGKLKFLIFAVIIMIVMASAFPNKQYFKRIEGAFDHLKTSRASSEVKKEKDGQLSTLASRLQIYKESLYIVKNNFPFGVGIGNFSLYHPKYKEKMYNRYEMVRKLYHAEEEIIHHTAELGIVGFIFIIYLFTYISKLILMTGKIEASDRIKYPLMAVFLTTISLAIFGFNLHRIEYIVTFFACLGFYDILNKPIVINFRNSISKKIIFISFLILPIIGLIFYSRVAISEKYLQKGLALYFNNNFPDAINVFKKAYNYNSFDEKTIFYLGTSYSIIGELERAKKFFQRGIECYPYEQRYYANYATVLIKEGEYKEAEDILNDSAREIAGNYTAYERLAFLYNKIYNDLPQARAYHEKAVSICPFLDEPIKK